MNWAFCKVQAGMVSIRLFLPYACMLQLYLCSIMHIELLLSTNNAFCVSGKLEVFVREDGERGVRALVPFRAGQFVCEFEANLLTKDEYKVAEQKYIEEDRPIYTLEVSTL